MAAATSTPSGPYRLHAFIQHGNVIRYEPMGGVSFTHIYQSRPNDARYAVAGHYSVALHDRTYLVWDLYGVLKDPVDHKLLEPKPVLKHDDLDAAIMAAVLLYERKIS